MNQPLHSVAMTTHPVIRFVRRGQVELAQEPLDPSPLGSHEALIRTRVTLVSAGTELARLNALETNTTFPLTPGYAAIGEVVAVGSAVNDCQVGDRVFFAGKHQAMQRFTCSQDHQWGRCYPVPAGLSDEDAVMVCLAQIALVAPWTAAAGPGDTVAVFGLGLIGNLCAQLYRLSGARVIGLDPVASRCDLARRCGINEVIAAPEAEQVAALRDLTQGIGAHLTIDAVGHSAVVASCVAATAPFGSVVLLGTPRAPLTGDLTAVLNRIHMEGISLRGAHMWRFPAAPQRGVQHTVADAYRQLFRQIGDGSLQVAPLRSRLARPDEAVACYRELEQQRDKTWGVLFDWRG